jgi:hypothetical protein
MPLVNVPHLVLCGPPWGNQALFQVLGELACSGLVGRSKLPNIWQSISCMDCRAREGPGMGIAGSAHVC